MNKRRPSVEKKKKNDNKQTQKGRKPEVGCDLSYPRPHPGWSMQRNCKEETGYGYEACRALYNFWGGRCMGMKSEVNGGQREPKGSFRGYPKQGGCAVFS